MSSIVPAPHRLTVDGMPAPVVTDSARPIFGWVTDSEFDAARVEVRDLTGALVWDSGFVPAPQPSLPYNGPAPAAKSAYAWRVQTRTQSGQPSPWSDVAEWETGLLGSAAAATWISRAVPPDTRPIRSIDHDTIEWAGPGEWLGQYVEISGRASGVSVHLTGERHAGVACTLEVCDASSMEVVASRRLGYFPHDRFSHWVALDTPPCPGRYLVRITDIVGRVGWLTASVAPSEHADDGVSARTPIGEAVSNGKVVPGMRTIGVEVEAAPNPRFMRTFEWSGPVASARLYGVGLGYGYFDVNGSRLSDAVLEPAPTAYDKRILYRAHDVTHAIREGENRIDALLGRGFFAARGTNEWAWQLAPWHQEPCLFVQLDITGKDGRTLSITTDQSWSAMASDIAADRLLNGERRQAPSSVAAAPAIVVASPGGRLEAAVMPPIRRDQEMPVAGQRNLAPGNTVYDFGRITAGWVRAELEGDAGGHISIAYGEDLDSDGNVVCINVHAQDEAQVDHYITDASDLQDATWEPQVTYKGFQYAQVKAIGGATVIRVSAVPVHNDVAKVGSFACEDDLLTWIGTSLHTTLQNNLHGIPTDTPIYEKNGWTADAHLVAEAALHHFDLHAFLRKWLRDHADAQDAEGSVPQIIPTPGWGCGLDPTWSASYPLLTWNTYFEYGDRQVLEEHIEGLLRYVRLLHRRAAETGLIWIGHSWGDWLSPGHHFPPEGPSPTSTLMMLRSTARTADICDVLGRSTDAAELRAKVADIGSAYHAKYFDAASGTYRSDVVGYRQSMNVLPLAFGVVPGQHVDSVVAGLVRDLRERTNEHLDVGSIATKHLLPVLSQHGYHDLAMRIATQTTRPGWGLWKEAGSQTLWESWDANVRSHNHFFLGSIDQWIHEDVAGLRPTAVGWSRFDIAPRFSDNVGWAKISHDTVRGTIELAWSGNAEALELTATVPANAIARLVLPTAAGGSIRVNGEARGPGDIELLPGQHGVTLTGASTARTAAQG